jgi:chromosome segregation ATPase
MKHLPLAILLMTSVAFAQSETPQTSKTTGEKKIEDPRTTKPKALTPTVAPAEDSPLVKASKIKGAERKAKLHMNNATIKASKGKLSETPGLPAVTMPAKVPDHREKLAKYDKSVEEWNQSVAQTEKSIASLTQEIEDLERLTGQYEEGFYNEDDPGYREVLEDKFTQSQERLTKAREELAKAREQEQSLANGKPRLD